MTQNEAPPSRRMPDAPHSRRPRERFLSSPAADALETTGQWLKKREAPRKRDVARRLAPWFAPGAGVVAVIAAVVRWVWG